MLFNSPYFLFIFAPIVIGIYFLLGRFINSSLAIVWVTLASLVFYCWEDPARLLLIISISILVNYIIGRLFRKNNKKSILIAGILFNLIYLFSFKYANFFLDSISNLGFAQYHLDIVLPIGISFYTFTQIAYLVDLYRSGGLGWYEIKGYSFFVTFFPHLIAGPILHHAEIMPQLKDKNTFKLNASKVALGLAWFSAGMFKKVVLADNLAPLAENLLAGAASGISYINAKEAWLGALTYSLQIYFDFSGYSDMAIGLALIMGFTFPLNFLSPYKATSLIEFWRHWNITLSRFLRDYLYIPLGGNRNGALRLYCNLVITMLLGGLWHGASWNFVVWGALHGVALAFNHAVVPWFKSGPGALVRLIGFIGTQLFVVIAWVPFRASDLDATLHIWGSMLGQGASKNILQPNASALELFLIATCVAIALFAPNTGEVFGRIKKINSTWLNWNPSVSWGVVCGCAFGISAGLCIQQPTVFIYFRF